MRCAAGAKGPSQKKPREARSFYIFSTKPNILHTRSLPCTRPRARPRPHAHARTHAHDRAGMSFENKAGHGNRARSCAAIVACVRDAV
jgi:hypothetical protein